MLSYGGNAIQIESVINDFSLWQEHYRAYLCLREPHNGLLG